MPALVSPHRLHDVVVGLEVHAATASDVGDRRGLELEVAEASRKGVLVVHRDELSGKDEQRVLEPGRVELVPRGVVQRGELDVSHHRPERCVQRFDLHLAHPRGRAYDVLTGSGVDRPFPGR